MLFGALKKANVPFFRQHFGVITAKYAARKKTLNLILTFMTIVCICRKYFVGIVGGWCESIKKGKGQQSRRRHKGSVSK